MLTEPSATRQDSRDTPPPTDLDPDVAHAAGLGAAGRATRRPRGSVSYAEPNLRDKMRRPTKSLIDAVSTTERQHNVITIKDEENIAPEPAQVKNGLRTVVIKKEDSTDPANAWKLPCPIENPANRQRFKDEQSSPSIITDKRRRTVGVQKANTAEEEEEEEGKKDGAAITKPAEGPPKLPTDEAKVDARATSMAKARERKRELRLSAMMDGRAGAELSSARSLARLRGDDGARDEAGGKVERAATRRRSMML